MQDKPIPSEDTDLRVRPRRVLLDPVLTMGIIREPIKRSRRISAADEACQIVSIVPANVKRNIRDMYQMLSSIAYYYAYPQNLSRVEQYTSNRSNVKFSATVSR